jgi:hypothetical protein
MDFWRSRVNAKVTKPSATTAVNRYGTVSLIVNRRA